MELIIVACVFTYIMIIGITYSIFIVVDYDVNNDDGTTLLMSIFWPLVLPFIIGLSIPLAFKHFIRKK